MRALTTNELKELYNKAGEQWLTDKPWLNPANSKAVYEVVAEMVIAKMLEVNQQEREPVAIYHGRCTVDCGAHGHLDMELLKMIPAGTKLYVR